MLKQNEKNKQQSNDSNNPAMAHDLKNSQNVQEQYVPSYRDIELLAHQIHEEKGGDELDNWLEAERLLREKHRSGGS